MSSYSSYCPTGQPLKISKANGIRFVYNTETGDFIYPTAPEDNVLYNDDPFCGSQTEEFQQPFPCDGIVRLQVVWCDTSIPYLAFYDTNDNLITQVVGTNIHTNYYEWDLNLSDDSELCERCVVIKIIHHELVLGSEIQANGNFASSSGGWYDYFSSALLTGLTNPYTIYPNSPGVLAGTIVIGRTYRVTVTVANVSVTNYIILLGGVYAISAMPINLTTPGTITFDFIATNNKYGFSYVFVSDSTATISNVSVKEVITVNIAEAISEPIKVSAYHHCLVKFEYWNDDAYDNIDYSLGYKNILYVGATFAMPKFPEESKVYLKSNGTTKKLSGRLKKLVPMKTDFIPAYMHEKMAIIFSHDNVEIDGVAFVKEGEYQIDSIDKYTLAQGSTDLTKVLYNYINSNCD